MARYRGLGAFAVNGKRYKAGQTYADTLANALAGDVIWNITSANFSPMMVPLDGPAIAIKAGSIHTGSTIPCFITGANSIEG